MAIFADGDVEPFSIVMGTGENVLIEVGEELAPTGIEADEEPFIKLFLPIIQR